MSAFDTFAKDMSRDTIIQLGQNVTYRGSGGTVTTVAVIERDTELFGAEIRAVDSRWTCAFLTEDVEDAQRGDEIVDEDNIIWILQDRRPESDKWLDEWTVTRR